MPQISATIITHNEALNIGRAIRSLGCADEIVVVDAQSIDQTAQIAQDLGARVIMNPWPGFAAQKNLACARARHDWILSLDADEELSTEGQQAIAEWKQAKPLASGYRLARRTRYLGRWILHSGWYPDYKLRLFDRQRGSWKGSHVHESVEVNGSVDTLPGDILHYTCDSIAEHRERIEFYTSLAAREMLEQKERVGALRRLVTPSWVFLNTYFFRLGILDGPQGFLIAKMAARYVQRKYDKWEQLTARAGGK